MSRLSLLHIANNRVAAPNFPIRTGFKKVFDYEEINWFPYFEQGKIPQLKVDIINKLKSRKFDMVWMQLQRPDIIDVATIDAMKKFSFIINWTGDVRNDISWYINHGKHYNLTLFTNVTDVDKMRAAGCVADYLQVGFDNIIYNPNNIVAKQQAERIVFCANNYASRPFPLCDYRKDIVVALKNNFHGIFAVYGKGWENQGIQTAYLDNKAEAEHYKNAAICISVSHFNYKRYSSDRLLRILGSGGFALSHNYKEYDNDFKAGFNIDVFNNIPELIAKCKFWLTPANRSKRVEIAKQAAIKAHADCTWTTRAKELEQIFQIYKNK